MEPFTVAPCFVTTLRDLGIVASTDIAESPMLSRAWGECGVDDASDAGMAGGEAI